MVLQGGTDVLLPGGLCLIVLFGAFGGEGNARHFEVSKRTILELKLFFLQNLYEWVEALGLFPIHFFVELIDICTF
jgi:hypothetical protein